VARGVPDFVGHALARRGRGRRPGDGRLLVPQVQGLADAIRHGVVGPGSEPVLSAVHGPREASARLADEAAETLVGEHVAPRRRSRFAARQVDHVLAAIGAEASKSVVELEVHRPLEGRRGLGRGIPATGREGRELGWRAFDPLQLTLEGTARRIQHHARGHLHEPAVLLRQLVGRDEVNPALAPQLLPRTELLEESEEAFTNGLDVSGRPLSKHDEIDHKTLLPPEPVTAQEIAQQLGLLGLMGLDEQDRQVAREPHAPESRLAEKVLSQ